MKKPVLRSPIIMADLTTFARTADFAAKKHRDQRRKDKESTPYINHPIGVANLAATLGGITDIVVLQVRIFLRCLQLLRSQVTCETGFVPLAWSSVLD